MTTLLDYLRSVATSSAGLIIEGHMDSGVGEGMAMQRDSSVSCWIEEARNGCEWAAVRLWERYREQLLVLARRRLGDVSRRMADEEDVAVTTFHSFLRRARQGEYPELANRDQLWKLLITITMHKVVNHIRDEQRLKRGGDWYVAATPVEEDGELPPQLIDPVSGESDPDIDVMMSDSLDYMLDLLDDKELKQIALGKLNGLTNHEIADAIRRSLPTVERRLRLIRDTWREEL